MTSYSRTLHHLGEWKIELLADSREELFAELARVLADAAGPAPLQRASTKWESLELEARDLATLLVDFANELVGRAEVTGCAYRVVRGVTLDESESAVRLAAELRADRADGAVSPVKAATLHGASAERMAHGWRAVVLLDV